MPDLVESVRLRLNVGLAANWSDRQLALAAIAAVLDDLEHPTNEMLGVGWTAQQMPSGGTQNVKETWHAMLRTKRRECGLDTTEAA